VLVLAGVVTGLAIGAAKGRRGDPIPAATSAPIASVSTVASAATLDDAPRVDADAAASAPPSAAPRSTKPSPPAAAAPAPTNAVPTSSVAAAPPPGTVHTTQTLSDTLTALGIDANGVLTLGDKHVRVVPTLVSNMSSLTDDVVMKGIKARSWQVLSQYRVFVKSSDPPTGSVTVAFEIVGDRPSRAQVSDSTFKLEFKYNAFPHMVASAMTGIQFEHAPPDTRGHGVVSYRFVVQ
jgi:hypothetical protein